VVFLGQHKLDFAHAMEGQQEKVHFSLEFLEFITYLGIYDVDVLGV
jgi:hypothetical protein